MLRARTWLFGIAAIAVAAVAAALVSQHVYGMQPCPWCVLQRAVFVAIAVVALLGAALPPAWLKRAAALLVMLLAGAGATAALWQHFVAAQAESCNLTLADRIVAALALDEQWPEVFMATASCSDAKVTLAGLPYEFWSLGLFLLVEAAALLGVVVPVWARRGAGGPAQPA